MKIFSLATISAVALLTEVKAISIVPNSITDVQLKSKSRSQSVIEANNQLFAELHSKIALVQKEAAAGNDAAASIGADGMNDVVEKVSERWLGSIDKEEPDIVDEFLRNMKDAVYDIHATEGFSNVKVAKARNGEDDWLTKIVQSNKKMQEMIPKASKEDRIAIADS